MNSVQAVLNSSGVAGFFQNASADLLLALASVLFAVAIAFIPYLASRIVRGEVGSSVVMIMRAHLPHKSSDQ